MGDSNLKLKQEKFLKNTLIAGVLTCKKEAYVLDLIELYKLIIKESNILTNPQFLLESFDRKTFERSLQRFRYKKGVDNQRHFEKICSQFNNNPNFLEAYKKGIQKFSELRSH